MRSRVSSWRSFLRTNAVACVGAGLGVLILGWVALSSWAFTDYDNEARPAFDALLGGHLQHFLQLAPAYGGSLVLRAPFVLVPKLWGGGELSTFRAAAAPSLAASAILGIWLVARMRTLGRARIARAVALFLCVANPMTLAALESGHSEELLGAVLCVAAVLVAMSNRPIWAGVLLGLAIANKEWALVAAGPVLLALPERRPRAVLAAGAAVALVLAPLMAARGGGFVSSVNGAATQAAVIFNPGQVWWFLGTHAHVIRDLSGHIVPGHQWSHRVEPSWLASIAHPLIVAIVLPLTLLCVWLRRAGARRPAQEGLLLLALVLLLRCMLDPWDVSYYTVPFLLALVAWEALSFERPPVLALGGAFAAWLALQWAGPARGFSPDEQSLLFLAFALPALFAIAVGLYVPGLWERFALRARRRAPDRGAAYRRAEAAQILRS